MRTLDEINADIAEEQEDMQQCMRMGVSISVVAEDLEELYKERRLVREAMNDAHD